MSFGGTGSPSGFSFGTPTTSTPSFGQGSASSGFKLGGATTSASGGFSLGGFSAGSSFGAKPGASPATTQSTGLSPASSFSLGAKPAVANTTVSNSPSTGGFNFGALKPASVCSPLNTSSAVTSSTTPSTTSAAASGFNLGATKPLTTDNKTPQSTSLFGNLSSPATTPTTQNASPVAASLTPSFGGLTKPTTSDSISKPATALTTNSALSFSSPTTSSTSNQLIPKSSAPAVAQPLTTTANKVQAAPQLTYRQLEEMINKWSQELDEQERNFLRETLKLNHWDRTLVANADRISNLHSKVQACESEQSRIEQELEFIEAQQRELEALLEPLENAAREFPPSQQHADAEREAIYQMAIGADLELGQLLTDLRQMANKINSSTKQVQTSAASYKLPNKCVKRLHCKQFAVRAVRFNSDGQYCLTAGGDKTVKLWNPTTGVLLKSYTGHGAEVSDVRASGDNSQIASGGADCVVALWDVASGQTLRRWRKHPGRVNAVMFAGPTLESMGPNQLGGASMLLSAGVDGIVFAWDTRAKSTYAIQKMHEAKDSVTCLAVNGHQIITGSLDRCVRIYDVRRGKMSEDFVGYPVTSVSISYDEQCILVGCQDSTIRLFDAVNGELLNKYQGHTNEAYHVDSGLFCRDALIVSGSEGESKSVYIWDLLRGGEPVALLNHNPGSPCWSKSLSIDPLPPKAVFSTASHFIHSVALHPKVSTVATGGGDYVWLWTSLSEEEDEAQLVN